MDIDFELSRFDVDLVAAAGSADDVDVVVVEGIADVEVDVVCWPMDSCRGGGVGFMPAGRGGGAGGKG